MQKILTVFLLFYNDDVTFLQHLIIDDLMLAAERFNGLLIHL